jgi:acyl-CoA dehydrogenase
MTKARKFALKEVLPIAWHFDRIGEFPLFLLVKAVKADLTYGDIPTQYGGRAGHSVKTAIIAPTALVRGNRRGEKIFD